jgi:cell wall-associated NlpC family hydrolase
VSVTGRHRAARPRTHRAARPRAHRLPTSAVGALGATALALPLTAGIATADTIDSAGATGGAVEQTPRTVTASDGTDHSRGERVVQEASEEWGSPYVYGGEGPLVYDCSGLTRYVYRQVGVELPHNAAAQYQTVEHISKSNMRRGDLVFFYNDDGVYHVGIYAGGDQMWAANETGDYVRKQEIWTDHFLVGRP